MPRLLVAQVQLCPFSLYFILYTLYMLVAQVQLRPFTLRAKGDAADDPLHDAFMRTACSVHALERAAPPSAGAPPSTWTSECHHALSQLCYTVPH